MLRSKALELLTFLKLTHLGSRPDFEVVVFLEPVKVRVFLGARQHGLIKHLDIIRSELARDGISRRGCQNRGLLRASDHRLAQITELWQVKFAPKVVLHMV